jgi:pimeloyl-ACP methyl ester carboxylesterase
VFYFNGGPGSRLEGLLFDELNQQLGVRMISVDRPGYGLSDYYKDRTYLDWPVDVSELADHLGIDRFAVLGWSSGGPYAAVVAHEIPERLTVVGIVSGEVPYQCDDFPQSTPTEGAWAEANEVLIWGANNTPWLMRALFRVNRIMLFSDPAASADMGGDMLAGGDMQFFSSDGFIAGAVEAFRPGADGMAQDFILERRVWPFEYEEILAPTVLVFHGGADLMLEPSLSDYVCMRIPTCDEPTIYPGEGHSAVYYRYEDIIQSILAAWE